MVQSVSQTTALGAHIDSSFLKNHGVKFDKVVSVFGTLGVGKSSCLNALLEREKLKEEN